MNRVFYDNSIFLLFIEQPARKTHLPDDQPLRYPRTRPEYATNKSIKLAPNNQPSVSGLSGASGSIPKPAGPSGLREALNKIKQKEVSGAAETSLNEKPKEPSGVARTSKNGMPRLTAAERLIKNGPGRCQNDDDDDDDGFVVFESKGRGHFKY